MIGWLKRTVGADKSFFAGYYLGVVLTVVAGSIFLGIYGGAPALWCQ